MSTTQSEYLTPTDRLIVEGVTAKAIAAGIDAVASAIRIHRRELNKRYEDLARLTSELVAVQRSIAMRELSIELLATA